MIPGQEVDGVFRRILLNQKIEEVLARESLLYYLETIRINSQPEPRPFGKIAEQWQRELVAPKIPALEFLAGLNPSYVGPLSFMDILGRGHDKSSLEGRICSWLLVASRKIIHGYILAADKDQGRLILQAIEDECRLNPWLLKHLTIRKNVVHGPAGFVEVIPADAPSAYGLRGNLYIADEFTHWKKADVWTAVISGREKIPGSLLMVLSNAGVEGTWQHDVRLAVESDPDWVLFEREGQLASWMDKDRVERLRRLLPPSEGRRLFDNRWIDPASEFDYLTRPEVRECVELGRSLRLRYMIRREPGLSNYVAAIDYGPKRDRTALCVLHSDKERVIRVDRLDVWQGLPEEPVSIDRVEGWMLDVQKAFNPRVFVIDPYQMESTIQWAEKRGMRVDRFASRGGAGNFELAQHLRSIIVNRELAWYPGAGDLDVVRKADGKEIRETFEDELVGLVVKKMPYGYRFDHKNQRHDDRAVCVGMAGLRAIDFPYSGDISSHAIPPTEKEDFPLFHKV